MCVWDLGSRNKLHGAPRALWSGLEFVRWLLDYVWAPEPPDGGGAGGADGIDAERAGASGRPGVGVGSGSDGETGGSGGGGESSGSGGSRAPPEAHLRGHRVTARFMQHYRALPQSARRRLAYYRRYTARVSLGGGGGGTGGGGGGVSLFGVYK